MELWTEYEGRTIDGIFPLTKLLRPEGRSAFFSTSNDAGVPRLIRLIEAHFDEDEILARWRRVTALNHPNILKLEEFGTVVIDDTSLIYAVMEPVDGNLGEVVNRQRLTVPETKQLAVSLVAALQTLHAQGFVHEHVAPANVLAVGEVVKLRSDCIREAPAGPEGQALKARDLHDLAVVLLEALTQQRTLEAAARNLPLPAPFDQVVPKAMSGEWGLVETAVALEPVASPRNPSRAAIAAETRAAAETNSSARTTMPSNSKRVEAPSFTDPIRVPISDEVRRAGPGTGLMAVIALAAILILWLGWHFLHRRPANQSHQTSATSAPVVDSGGTSSATASDPVAPPRAATAPNKDAAGVRGQWRVIAYTYNHAEQAQQKSAAITQQHPELRPEVFTPNGHAPYLVTVGGTMSRDEAFALARKVRIEGLPRDSYAQNYRSNAP